MHACGHDLHATALVATAEVMAEQKDKWRGTLVFVAQPGEENLKGAQAMIDAGLFSKIPKPENVITAHTFGLIPFGKVGIATGPEQAAAENMDIVFKGVGTHGSQKGVDPIVLASEFVIKMQTLVGREIDATDSAVISVGSIHGGGRPNVIPDEVKVQLTMRTFNEENRTRLLKRIKEVADGLAKTDLAPPPVITLTESAPVVVNDKALADRFREAVGKLLGSDKIIDMKRIMASEDFARLGQNVSARNLKIYIGSIPGKNPVPNHSPKFAPDAKAILPEFVRVYVAGLMDLHGDSAKK
jgi:hippurate hydrolase